MPIPFIWAIIKKLHYKSGQEPFVNQMEIIFDVKIRVEVVNIYGMAYMKTGRGERYPILDHSARMRLKEFFN